MNVIISAIEETTIKIPNKRGPKKISEKLKNTIMKSVETQIQEEKIFDESVDDNVDTNCVNNNKKKRGRKPKGGKIVSLQSKLLTNETIQPKNIILHLKCSLKEIIDDVNSQSNISYYNLSRNSLDFESVVTRTDDCFNNNKNENIYTDINFNEKFCIATNKENEIVEMNLKLEEECA